VHERALELCRTLNISARFAQIASQLGYAYVLSDSLAEGILLLEQASFKGRSVWRSFQLACLSEAYLLVGRIDDAINLAQQALEFARAHQERGHQAWALRLLGEIATRREPPDVDQAGDHYHQALALASELGMRPLAVHCHRGFGTLCLQMGRRGEARTELSIAIELYRAMAMTFWLPQAEAALTQVEGP
jgi:tetratricopeptide (TPR) repeat protein